MGLGMRHPKDHLDTVVYRITHDLLSTLVGRYIAYIIRPGIK